MIVHEHSFYVITVMTQDKTKMFYAANGIQPLAPSFVEWSDSGYPHTVVKFDSAEAAVKWWNNAMRYNRFAYKIKQRYDESTLAIQKRSEIVKLDEVSTLSLDESDE